MTGTKEGEVDVDADEDVAIGRQLTVLLALASCELTGVPLASTLIIDWPVFGMVL